MRHQVRISARSFTVIRIKSGHVEQVSKTLAGGCVVVVVVVVVVVAVAFAFAFAVLVVVLVVVVVVVVVVIAVAVVVVELIFFYENNQCQRS